MSVYIYYRVAATTITTTSSFSHKWYHLSDNDEVVCQSCVPFAAVQK